MALLSYLSTRATWSAVADDVLSLAAVSRRRGRRGHSDRAASAQARARAAREVRRGQAAAARAGRAHREASPARAAAAGAARRGAGAAGARVRAAVLRVRRGVASARRDGRRARHVAQHVGARPVRARAAAREGRDRAARRPAIWSASSRLPTTRIWSRRPSADRALALSAVDGGRARIRRDAAIARRSAPRRRALGGRRGTIVVVTDLQESGWDAGDRASVPESATHRGRRRRRAAAESRGDRRPVGGDRVIATVRNTGPPRARRACV